MTDELIEQVARVVGQKVEGAAEDMDSLWYGQPLWKAYIEEARAVLPIIKAARTQGWNEAIEAAAGAICGLVAKHAQDAVVADVADKLGQVIRALTKENSDA